MYEYDGKSYRQDRLSHRQSFNIICNTGYSQNGTDCKVYHCNAAQADGKLMMQPFLNAVRIKKDRERTQKDHNEAQRTKGGGVGNQDLPEFGLTQHPYSAHDHAPSKIFHIKACVVNDSKGKAEEDRNDPGKQDEKRNISFQSVFAENLYPDIGSVPTVDGIDNAGIVGCVSGQFNAEFFACVGSVDRTENIAAGGIFADQTCFTCGIAGPKRISYIKVHILQGRTDGKGCFGKIIGKLYGEDHCITDRNLVSSWNGYLLGSSIRFLPGNGAGIDHRACGGIRRTFIRTKDLHKKEPAKDGKHQDIKEISFSLVKGFGFFFHGNLLTGDLRSYKLKNPFMPL